jgi:hypothetical protein
MKSDRIDRHSAQRLHDTGMASGVLIIWTIYENPKDYPGLFIARPFALARGNPRPSPFHLEGTSLSELREQLPHSLVQLGRREEDEPQIVEVWL